MINLRRLSNVAALLLLFGGHVHAAGINPGAPSHATATLVAERPSLTPGSVNWLALELTPQEGWHTYWRNPGQAGLPTTLEWHLPPGVTAEPMLWPAPKRLLTGKIVSYGYDQPSVYPVAIRIPKSVKPGRHLTLTATASWLVCRNVCIPEQTDVSLTLPVTATPAAPNPVQAALFQRARKRLPANPPSDWNIRYTTSKGRLLLGIDGTGLSTSDQFQFFPRSGQLIDDTARQDVAVSNQGLRLSVPLSGSDADTSPPIQGVLKIVQADGQTEAYQIDAPRGAVAPLPEAKQPIRHQTALWMALALALLGGLILNLMPCVFPVLAMKAFALINHRDSGARRHALSYSAGVIVSMAAIGGSLLALRAGGHALGWGFQLQSPVIVAGLALLLFILGLWMSGVVNVGGSWMGMGQGLTQRGGLAGSFFTGVLAVVVASPCTAPFMGAALGFALTQPAVIAMAVFLALGFGLALPFLVIAVFPGSAAWLPKPGAWMDTFKQLMAFPLYLSAVWLVWVLANQAGPNAVALALLAMVIVALGFWSRHHWPNSRLSAFTLMICLVGAIALLARVTDLQKPPPPAQTATSAGVTSEPYSAARLQALRAEGRTVFIDFTADWCITCKVNEKVAISTPEVQAAFAKYHVAWLIGDWTRNDPAITRVLNQFNRPGVPLYLVYHGMKPAEVLPQILTPEIVIHAVANHQ